jgi:hypothetical protein
MGSDVCISLGKSGEQATPDCIRDGEKSRRLWQNHDENSDFGDAKAAAPVGDEGCAEHFSERFDIFAHFDYFA